MEFRPFRPHVQPSHVSLRPRTVQMASVAMLSECCRACRRRFHVCESRRTCHVHIRRFQGVVMVSSRLTIHFSVLIFISPQTFSQHCPIHLFHSRRLPRCVSTVDQWLQPSSSYLFEQTTTFYLDPCHSHTASLNPMIPIMIARAYGGTRAWGLDKRRLGGDLCLGQP
jgi:hypothetical protein